MTGVSATIAATADGSICNGIGRLLWAGISDAIGCSVAFALHALVLVARAHALMLL